MNLNKLNFTQKYGRNWEEPYYEAHPLVPKGFIIPDGRPLKITDFPELYKAIGHSWGTPNTDTFNVPDFRGIISGRGLTTPKPGDVVMLMKVKVDPTPTPAGTDLPIGTVVNYCLRRD